MERFGFALQANGPRQPPEGYATATVYLGGHRETIFYFSKLWSAADYVQHWHEAAEALLGGETRVLFCTDFATPDCTCFVGWPDNDGFVFEEWVIKREDVVQRGHRLNLPSVDVQPNAGNSHFPVSRDYVQAFVSSRS